MQHYTFELDENSADICLINNPFRLFTYNCLPMGITIAPDLAQEIMDSIFCDLPEVNVYLDDIDVFTSNWHSHLDSSCCVLQLLETNVTVNLSNVNGVFRRQVGLAIG